MSRFQGALGLRTKAPAKAEGAALHGYPLADLVAAQLDLDSDQRTAVQRLEAALWQARNSWDIDRRQPNALGRALRQGGAAK